MVEDGGRDGGAVSGALEVPWEWAGVYDGCASHQL